MTKSPFYVIEHFISPLLCEDIIDRIGFNEPDRNQHDDPVATIRTNKELDLMLFTRLESQLSAVCDYYHVEYRGTERMRYEWYSTGTQSEFIAENAERIKGRWMRTKNRDVTGILFLSDYQDQPPLDPEFETYGGRLEFVQHRFGFNPSRGTLVLFPSDPHFINITSEVLLGNAMQVRMQIVAQQPYVYKPADFPGDYSTWF